LDTPSYFPECIKAAAREIHLDVNY